MAVNYKAAGLHPMTPTEYLTVIQQVHATAMSCKPADFPVAVEVISQAYREIRLPTPQFILLPSPFAFKSIKPPQHPLDPDLDKDFGTGLLQELQHNERQEGSVPLIGLLAIQAQINRALGLTIRTPLNSAIYSYLVTDPNTLSNRLDTIRRLRIIGQIASSCGYWFPYKDICYIIDRPLHIHLDDSDRLHSETGPTVEWRDHTSLYFWHNYEIPPWLITDKRLITAEAILSEPNAELRRIMCEITKYEPLISHALLLATDTDGNGLTRCLLSVHLARFDDLRIIEVQNGTLEPDGTRRKFLLGALPGDTPHDCIARSYGIHPTAYHEAIRT